MCFSANASLAAGAVLLPIGTYCTAVAVRKNTSYLPLALTPILFGVQQLCEAGVWLGLERAEPRLIEPAALAFLFFAIAFWPCWIPFAAAAVEPRPGRRRLFLALAAVGLGLGCLSYFQAAWHYGEWLSVEVAGHSIVYDLTRLPVAQAVATAVWQGLYLGLVCVPLLLSYERRLPALGVSVAVAAVVAHVAFRYAFASVWCFFAALLSAHISYVLYQLPERGGYAKGEQR